MTGTDPAQRSIDNILCSPDYTSKGKWGFRATLWVQRGCEGSQTKNVSWSGAMLGFFRKVKSNDICIMWRLKGGRKHQYLSKPGWVVKERPSLYITIFFLLCKYYLPQFPSQNPLENFPTPSSTHIQSTTKFSSIIFSLYAPNLTSSPVPLSCLHRRPLTHALSLLWRDSFMVFHYHFQMKKRVSLGKIT